MPSEIEKLYIEARIRSRQALQRCSSLVFSRQRVKANLVQCILLITTINSSVPETFPHRTYLTDQIHPSRTASQKLGQVTILLRKSLEQLFPSFCLYINDILGVNVLQRSGYWDFHCVRDGDSHSCTHKWWSFGKKRLNDQPQAMNLLVTYRHQVFPSPLAYKPRGLFCNHNLTTASNSQQPTKMTKMNKGELKTRTLSELNKMLTH